MIVSITKANQMASWKKMLEHVAAVVNIIKLMKFEKLFGRARQDCLEVNKAIFSARLTRNQPVLGGGLVI